MTWYGRIALVFMLAVFALAYWSAVVERDAEPLEVAARPRVSLTRAAPAPDATGEASHHAD